MVTKLTLGRVAATVALSLVLLGSLAVLPAGAAGEGGTDGIETDLPADDLAVVARGEEIYAVQCASCHGAELEGQPDWRSRGPDGLLPAPPHDASGHTWHHADDLLFEIVKYGPGAVIGDPAYRSAMPAYEGVLDDEDIVAALTYIKHSWPAEERRWQAEVDAPREPFGGSAGGGTPGEAGTPGGDGTSGNVLERLFR